MNDSIPTVSAVRPPETGQQYKRTEKTPVNMMGPEEFRRWLESCGKKAK